MGTILTQWLLLTIVAPPSAPMHILGGNATDPGMKERN